MAGYNIRGDRGILVHNIAHWVEALWCCPAFHRLEKRVNCLRPQAMIGRLVSRYLSFKEKFKSMDEGIIGGLREVVNAGWRSLLFVVIHGDAAGSTSCAMLRIVRGLDLEHLMVDRPSNRELG
jgi:hypothetical protein